MAEDNNKIHPVHYAWLREYIGIEPIDICRHLNFNLGNVVKYVLRCGRKTYDGQDELESAMTDLRKAERYIQDEIERLETIKFRKFEK